LAAEIQGYWQGRERVVVVVVVSFFFSTLNLQQTNATQITLQKKTKDIQRKTNDIQRKGRKGKDEKDLSFNVPSRSMVFQVDTSWIPVTPDLVEQAVAVFRGSQKGAAETRERTIVGEKRKLRPAMIS